jgi:hypothetical protein
VRYEDLQTHLLAHVRRMLNFLQMDADDGTVTTCVEAASFRKKSGRAPGQKDNTSFFRSGTTGDWRNHIPEELANLCCAKIAALMADCGYQDAAPIRA